MEDFLLVRGEIGSRCSATKRDRERVRDPLALAFREENLLEQARGRGDETRLVALEERPKTIDEAHAVVLANERKVELRDPKVLYDTSADLLTNPTSDELRSGGPDDLRNPRWAFPNTLRNLARRETRAVQEDDAVLLGG